jgi:long-chain acyl-CoA synthetase
VVASITVGPAADELPKLLPSLTFTSVGGSRAGFMDFEAARAEMPETPLLDERPGQDMLYSSGTTGRPKGVRPALPDRIDLAQRTHISLLGERLYGFDSDTIYLSVGPLYHSAPLRFSMAVQKLGGTVIVMQKFDAEDALRLIERYRRDAFAMGTNAFRTAAEAPVRSGRPLRPKQPPRGDPHGGALPDARQTGL